MRDTWHVINVSASSCALCEEYCEDDGIDPREFFQPTRKRTKEHRKSKQLCRQVQKTLDLVLTGETGDELLNSLRVVSITPGADYARLLVTVAADVRPEQFDRRTIEGFPNPSADVTIRV